MAEIFINSRTADEPYGAALLDKCLSDSFGDDVVFRASKSISPGEDFAETMLEAVRRCTVLLAVIGPQWMAELRRHDPAWQVDPAGDWVRREIVEAFASGVRVIPVLMGTTRIDAADLPADIARLAKCQDVRVHFRDTGYAMPAFVARLRELIPGLPDEPAEVPKRPLSIHAHSVTGLFTERVDVAGNFTVVDKSRRKSAGSEQ